MVFASVLALWPAGLVQAATPTYTAAANQYDNVKFAPGETRKITLVYKNTGTATWEAGKGKVGLYLVGSSSVLGHSSWLKDDMPGLIDQAKVKPGGRATATFLIHAPSVPGTYTEKFVLSSGPGTWVKGSTSKVRFVVGGTSKPVATAPAPAPKPAPTPTPAPTPAPAPSAKEQNDAATAKSLILDTAQWKAEVVERGGLEFQIEPDLLGSTRVVFKNTGKTTWTKEGPNAVELRTAGGDEDQFQDESWPSLTVASHLKEAKVAPGQTGSFLVNLRAPEVPGSYDEAFSLTAASGTRIVGGDIGWKVRVPMTRDMIIKGVPDGAYANAADALAGTYRASLLLRSEKGLTLLGNGRQSLTFGFKNIGTATWNNLSVRLASVVPLLTGKQGWVRDESWLNSLEAVRTASVTGPGQIGFLGFTVKAPARKGAYTATFQLMADNQPVSDGVIDIPITVTADGWIEPEDTKPTPGSVPTGIVTAPSVPAYAPPIEAQPLNGDINSLPNEPIIRVGLFPTTDDQMIVRGVQTNVGIYANGNKVCDAPQGASVTISYDRESRISHASGGGCTAQTTDVFVAQTPDSLAPIEITDFSRPVAWLPGANDNTFRGKVELRYTPKTDKVWIINELPIEYYLKGLAETSDVSPQEFQRTLLTAARTYALYHVYRGTKHADENYTVDAKYDQVYRGYGSEARSPNIVAGVEATRGQIVTYNGQLAITPYFSRSDGRTRSWGEVWYGGSQYPWLVGVPVPEDAGKTLWGHGVGLSATGALTMAAREGKTYDQILKYFYTGIEIRRAYK